MPRKSPRALHLKIRVRLTRRMTAASARLLLERAIESGTVPPGIEIRYMDWQTSEHGVAGEGRVMPAGARDALRQFHGAIRHAEGARFEPVKG
jgi:hypothetical protein